VRTLPRRGYRFIGPVAKPHLQAVAPVTPKGSYEKSPDGRKWA
jgi:DNA-binding winged helix-turn-helix (wHTH) protein